MKEAYRGFEAVKVDRKDIMEIILDNREEHRRLFEEAMEGYKVKVIELLEAHIERVKANAPEQVSVILPMPEDHTSDYDFALDMLEWSKDEFLVLDAHEFNQYVRDQWGWKHAFTESYTAYAATP